MNDYWCIPSKEDADFMACMENVLDVYKLPYDPMCLVVYMNEKPYQLLDDVKKLLPDFGLKKTLQLANGNIINLKYISRIQWGKVILRCISMDIPISFQDWFRLKQNYKKYS